MTLRLALNHPLPASLRQQICPFGMALFSDLVRDLIDVWLTASYIQHNR